METIKLKYSSNEIEFLSKVMEFSINRLNKKIETDIKEISVYRIFEISKLYKKFYTKIMFKDKKIFKISFEMNELLAFRYSLVSYLSVYDEYDVRFHLMKIDKFIHPKMFERNEK